MSVLWKTSEVLRELGRESVCETSEVLLEGDFRSLETGSTQGRRDARAQTSGDGGVAAALRLRVISCPSPSARSRDK